MTSHGVLVFGYKINPYEYMEFHGKQCQDAEEFKNEFEGANIFVVTKSYDSTDFNDYEFFNAQEYFDLENGSVNLPELLNFLTSLEITIEKMPYHTGEGLMISYYDWDEGYEFI